MADYNVLKAAIADYVKDRTGLSTIDGDGLQETLLAMVNSLGAGYQFIDVATPSTNPGTPDQNVFYIAAEPGTYTNFPISGGYLQLAENEVAIFKYNGQWSKKTTGAATADAVNRLGQQVIYDVSEHNSGATFASLSALLSDADLATLIPIGVRCGGMSIRFIQTSDNNYMRYNLLADEFTTDVTKWQGVDDKPTANSKNLVKSGGVEKVNNANNLEIYGLKGITIHRGRINDANTGFDNINDGNWEHITISVNEGDTITFGSDNTSATYLFASECEEPWNGNNGKIIIVGNKSAYRTINTLTVPSGAKYLVLTTKRNGTSVQLTNFKINGADYDEYMRKYIFQVNSFCEEVNAKSNNIDYKYDIRSYSEKLKEGLISYSEMPLYEGRINASTGKWYQLNANNKHFAVEIKQNDIIFYTGLDNVVLIIGDYIAPVLNESANLLQIVNSAENTVAQSGAKYIVVDCLNSGNNVRPSKLLINGIDYSVIFDNTYKEGDKSMSDISDESFEKQMVCLLHDNFFRESDFEPEHAWDIGSNYRTSFNPMVNIPYEVMNSSGDDSVDDGFRLYHDGNENALINDANATLSYGIRIIPSFAYIKDEAVIEMSYPFYGKRCSFAFNIIDGKNYETITFVRKNSVDAIGSEIMIIYYSYQNNQRTATILYDGNIVGNLVKIQTKGRGINLWIDNFVVNDFAGDLNRIAAINNITFDFSKSVGIQIEKNNPCELKFINIYDVRQKYIININRDIDIIHVSEEVDKQKSNINGLMVVNGTGHYSLSNTIESKSIASQRFELIKEEVGESSSTKRIEYSQSGIKRRTNLRKYKAKFDIFLPNSEEEYYANDAGVITYEGTQELDFEILFQMHDLYAEGTEVSPNIALRTAFVDENEWFGIAIRGSYKGGDGIIGSITQKFFNKVVEAERGVWHHFEIYVKEGYIPEHNPLLIVEHNGECVLRYRGVNAYNRALGSYGRYGIYKPFWGYDEVKEQTPYDKRILYIDNFALEI